MSNPGGNGDQVEFRCEHCNGKILVPSNLPSTTGPCPHCQKQITSPGTDLPPELDPIFGRPIKSEPVPAPPVAGPPPLPDPAEMEAKRIAEEKRIAAVKAAEEEKARVAEAKEAEAKAEQERQAAEAKAKAEEERKAADAEKARLAAEAEAKAEQERQAAEAKAKAEEERKAADAEKARQAAEAEAAEKAEAEMERQAAESKAEMERRAAESKAQMEAQAAEARAEMERQAAEAKAEHKRLAQSEAAAKSKAAELKAAEEKEVAAAAAAAAAQVKLAGEKAEQERQAAAKAAEERAIQEKAAAEKAALQKAEQEKLAAGKAAEEMVAKQEQAAPTLAVPSPIPAAPVPELPAKAPDPQAEAGKSREPEVPEPAASSPVSAPSEPGEGEPSEDAEAVHKLKKAKRRIPVVPLVVMFALIVVAGGAALLIPKLLRDPTDPIVAEQSALAIQKEEEYLKSGWEADARKVLKEFLAAETAAGKASHAIRGGELLGEMEDYYGEGKIDDSDTPESAFSVFPLELKDKKRGIFMLSYDRPPAYELSEFFTPLAPLRVKYGLTEPDMLLASVGRSNNFTTETLQVHALFKRSEDGLRLDWETFVQTKYRTLRDFLEIPEPGLKGVFRVIVSETVPEKRNAPAGHRTYLIADPAHRSIDSVRVYVPGDSDIGRAFSILNWRGTKENRVVSKTATLELAWSNEATPQLEVSRFICWEFLGVGGEAVAP